MQNDDQRFPCSPATELDGLPYFPRMCEKIRLHSAGKLHPGLYANLGQGMDLWTCQFLGVDYEAIEQYVASGASDAEALAWARNNGVRRPTHEYQWWLAFMRTVGFRDHLTEKLRQRKAESGLEDRADILTMFDYIDADEGRSTPEACPGENLGGGRTSFQA